MQISTKLYAGFLIVVALITALAFYTFTSSRAALLQAESSEALASSEEIMKRIDRGIVDKILDLSPRKISIGIFLSMPCQISQRLEFDTILSLMLNIIL